MANRWYSDHHNNDSGDNIDNTILTRTKFLEFCEETRDENKQFCDETQQKLDRIHDALVALLTQKPNRDDEERRNNQVHGPLYRGPNQNRR